MEAIILLGAPGAGKGTVAGGLTKAADLVHVSTGDMLREAVKAGSPVGLRARDFMTRGELVPDEVILGIVRERLQRDPDGTRYLFDGFPRTLEQARGLDALIESLGGRLRGVFQLEVPEAVVIERLAGRRTCRQCGAVYHVRNIPTRVDGVCDRCGGETVQRPDDGEATVRNRLEVYRAQTEPLVAYYRERGVLVDVKADGPREETEARILERLAGA